MPRPEVHVFVCLNQREPGDPRGDCLSKGAAQVHALLKEGVKSAGLDAKIRVNKAGCLDQCAKGVVVVVYPEGTWYQHVTPDGANRILQEHLQGGALVQDLLMGD